MVDKEAKVNKDKAIAERKFMDSKYQVLMEAAMDVILMSKSDGEIIEVNDAAVRVYGYSRKELLSLKLQNLRKPKVLPDLDEQIKKAKAGIIYETAHRRKDGSFFPAQISGRCTSGQKDIIIWIVRDITVEKRREALNQLVKEGALKVLEEQATNEITGFICNQLREIFGLYAVWIGLKQSNGMVSTMGQDGFSKGFLNKKKIFWGKPKETGTIGNVVCTGKKIIINTPNTSFENALDKEIILDLGIGSYGVLPLTDGKETFGAVAFFSKEANYFSEELISNFERFVSQVAVAIKTALANSEIKLLKGAVDSAANAIVITDREAKIKWFNKAFLMITDYSAQDVIGKNIYEEFKAEGLPKPETIIKEVQEKNIWRGEITAFRKDATFFSVDITVSPVKDQQGEIINFITVAEDITERKKAEEESKKYNEKIDNVLESISDAFFTMDFEGQITYLNSSAVKFFKNFIQVGENVWERYPGLINSIFYDYCQKAVTDSLPVELREFVPKLQKWLAGNIYPSKEGLSIYFRDITEFKLAEAERAKTQERIVQAHRLASLGNMAAGIAHEINQPLNSLKVTADGILYWHKRGKQLDANTIMEKFQTISNQADRIDGIIKHMCSLVRNFNQPKLEPCNLNDIINSALNLVGMQLSSHGIEVKKTFLSELPFVLGEAARLEEVVINLLVNAMQSLDTVNKKYKEIICSTFLEDKVIVEISDNGVNISDEVIGKVFEPFFTTKPVGEGMGIGLAFAHSTVTTYNGLINIRNNAEGGVTVHLEFPVINSISREK